MPTPRIAREPATPDLLVTSQLRKAYERASVPKFRESAVVPLFEKFFTTWMCSDDDLGVYSQQNLDEGDDQLRITGTTNIDAGDAYATALFSQFRTYPDRETRPSNLMQQMNISGSLPQYEFMPSIAPFKQAELMGQMDPSDTLSAFTLPTGPTYSLAQADLMQQMDLSNTVSQTEFPFMQQNVPNSSQRREYSNLMQQFSSS
ncbi:hypothetical protein ACJ73_08642 [Blastomyces percursus]|uniref:Uncharacterized protein n=1 Tax=Blastomyces percursus TaxID=1658174 RepID=A0A1J9QGY7_9EURO|nr:hypothetical protein ACJ73_08642 [Blastomyces percursus]